MSEGKAPPSPLQVQYGDCPLAGGLTSPLLNSSLSDVEMTEAAVAGQHPVYNLAAAPHSGAVSGPAGSYGAVLRESTTGRGSAAGSAPSFSAEFSPPRRRSGPGSSTTIDSGSPTANSNQRNARAGKYSSPTNTTDNATTTTGRTEGASSPKRESHLTQEGTISGLGVGVGGVPPASWTVSRAHGGSYTHFHQPQRLNPAYQYKAPQSEATNISQLEEESGVHNRSGYVPDALQTSGAGPNIGTNWSSGAVPIDFDEDLDEYSDSTSNASSAAAVRPTDKSTAAGGPKNSSMVSNPTANASPSSKGQSLKNRSFDSFMKQHHKALSTRKDAMARRVHFVDAFHEREILLSKQSNPLTREQEETKLEQQRAAMAAESEDPPYVVSRWSEMSSFVVAAIELSSQKTTKRHKKRVKGLWKAKLALNILILATIIVMMVWFADEMLDSAVVVHARKAIAKKFSPGVAVIGDVDTVEINTVDDILGVVERIVDAYHDLPSDHVAMFQHFVGDENSTEPMPLILEPVGRLPRRLELFASMQKLYLPENVEDAMRWKSSPDYVILPPKGELTRSDKLGPLKAYRRGNTTGERFVRQCGVVHDPAHYGYLFEPCRTFGHAPHSFIPDDYAALKIHYELRQFDVQTAYNRQDVVHWKGEIEIAFDNDAGVARIVVDSVPRVMSMRQLPIYLLIVSLILIGMPTAEFILFLFDVLEFLRTFGADQSAMVSYVFVAVLGDICMLVTGFMLLGNYIPLVSGGVTLDVLYSFRLNAYFLGIGGFMCIVRLPTHIRSNKRATAILVALIDSLPHLGRFSLGCIPLFVGFAFFGTTVFGGYNENFSNFGNAIVSQFCLMNADDLMDSYVATEGPYGNVVYILFARIYMYLYVAIFIFLAVNMTFAVVQSCYNEVRNYLRQQNDYLEMLNRRRTRAKCSLAAGQIKDGDGVTREELIALHKELKEIFFVHVPESPSNAPQGDGTTAPVELSALAGEGGIGSQAHAQDEDARVHDDEAAIAERRNSRRHDRDPMYLGEDAPLGSGPVHLIPPSQTASRTPPPELNSETLRH